MWSGQDSSEKYKCNLLAYTIPAESDGQIPNIIHPKIFVKKNACSVSCNAVMITASNNENLQKKNSFFHIFAIMMKHRNVNGKQPNGYTLLCFNIQQKKRKDRL
jgi:hypothetical protein